MEAAKRLVARRPSHRVISLYVDLDPERFATAPARATQITSLLDEGTRAVEGDAGLEHEDKVALREDLERLRRYLLSREAPFQGAHALAIFCSGRDDLFEVVQSPRPLPGRIAVARAPCLAPLLLIGEERRWCVALVNRADARILIGTPDRLSEQERVSDDVHGQHDQGGFSQAGYQRSVEEDVASHLRHVAGELETLYRRERFDQLTLGGPREVVSQFEELLDEELRARLTEARVSVDVGSASEAQIRRAASKLVADIDRQRERTALDHLADGLGSGGRAAGGPEAVLQALTERRVHTLLLGEGVELAGGRCPSCGLLGLRGGGACPADGTRMQPLDSLPEAAIEAALEQDAEVLIVQHYPDLEQFQGFAALLRF
jgi:peptide chain release factor subunit 1